jgi:Uncharacterized protein conserved in bacteria (DUF2188)
VHVVPGEHRTWNVVDLDRRGFSFPTKSAALEFAKNIAVANQPSQVVLFDAFGRVEPVAHYHLPVYQVPHHDSAQNGATLFEATMKALLIGGFAAAGIAVLGDLVDRVEREARKESAKSRKSASGTRRSRRV